MEERDRNEWIDGMERESTGEKKNTTQMSDKTIMLYDKSWKKTNVQSQIKNTKSKWRGICRAEQMGKVLP